MSLHGQGHFFCERVRGKISSAGRVFFVLCLSASVVNTRLCLILTTNATRKYFASSSGLWGGMKKSGKVARMKAEKLLYS